ncbi:MULTISPECIES: tyrosine recombinase XerC [unclassified Rathayibacter]|uniref:site-specific integrase n=1 Tax=unclassified Rathayibacter TaxID=2609250 RepID=UPI001414D1C4|nr:MULTISPECIES: tyrosine-type recombinase/integrase [unclassified Rathayibacter]
MATHPFRPLLVLTFGAHLRLGELIALERRDLDLDSGTLVVERQTVTVGGEHITTPTKTGNARTVALPASIIAAMREHLAGRGSTFGRAPLFAQADGRGYSRAQVQRAWKKATRALELDQFQVHDIRHAGLTAAAQAGRRRGS